eukprot:scaffold137362_cov49-Attheya_sp.AAC.2
MTVPGAKKGKDWDWDASLSKIFSLCTYYPCGMFAFRTLLHLRKILACRLHQALSRVVQLSLGGASYRVVCWRTEYNNDLLFVSDSLYRLYLSCGTILTWRFRLPTYY